MYFVMQTIEVDGEKFTRRLGQPIIHKETAEKRVAACEGRYAIDENNNLVAQNMLPRMPYYCGKKVDHEHSAA